MRNVITPIKIAMACLLSSSAAIAHSATLDTCAAPAIAPLPILPDTALSALSCKPRLEIELALDEYEPASLVIRSSVDVPDLTIAASELRNGANTIAAIDIRYVKTWYQSNTAWQATTQQGQGRKLVPELLLRDPDLIRVDHTARKNFAGLDFAAGRRYVDISDPAPKKDRVVTPIAQFPIADADTLRPLSLARQQTQQLWLTVSAPPTAVPGRYIGRIALRSKQLGIEQNVPVTVNVRPFQLGAPDLIYSIYYRGLLDEDGQGSISSELKTEQQMAAEYRNMRQHGISNPTIYQPPNNFALLDQVLNIRKQAGIGNAQLYYLGIKTENYGDLRSLNARYRLFQDVSKRAARHGTEKIYIYAIDEADFSDIQKQLPVWTKFRQLGAGIFAADWKHGLVEQYAGKLELLVSGITPDLESNRYLQQQGTRVFAYNRPQVGVENPYVYRRNYGLQAWQNGFDGVMNYAYQHSMADIWNDFDQPTFRDHAFAYPTRNGVIDTLAWEGFREAVDDVRYLSTLRTLAEQAGSRGDLHFIQTLRTANIANEDTLRGQLAERIEALCAKPHGGQLVLCRSAAPAPVTDFEAIHDDSRG